MPKRTDIKSILIIGAGPIVIGQACEFDYSGTQACKALKEEGYKIILVNSNPATIMTDPEMADVTYVEPITKEIVSKIIEKELPDAILPTMGGQTALNIALSLHEGKILEKFNVELIGAKPKAIEKAENRFLFRQAMEKIGLESAKSSTVNNLDEALVSLKKIGLPAIIRPSFTLGGEGGGIAYNINEFEQIVKNGLHLSPISEILIEESLLGWKEFEMEVVRDNADNCIIVCSIENVDPMGVHTGDSITVAPSLTLTDKEYQLLRNASISVLREIGVDTGGSNVQFAINPNNGRIIVIEMNPRVSRSSALASKATGFPIAKIAAKLAVGYRLDELQNDITGFTPSSFEPTIDYIVTKIPRFAFEKFTGASNELTTSMKSVGEVMAIGRSFPESLQKALQSLEIGLDGLDEIKVPDNKEQDFKRNLKIWISKQIPERIIRIAQCMREGLSIDEIHEVTKWDRWFLDQIALIVSAENWLKKNKKLNERKTLFALKSLGFSDKKLANLLKINDDEVFNYRKKLGVFPSFKRIDTCAAEFLSNTAYLYSSYENPDTYSCESNPTNKEKIVILGSGPNRIGQGIEFDYCCVQACFALSNSGYETIMINCNPETVSTDYDTSDRLYFEPLTKENVLSILECESQNGKINGVIVQLGGQTPLKIASYIEEAGYKILGTSSDAIDLAEDREKFKALLQKLNLKQPKNGIASNAEEAKVIIEKIGLPVVIRPSYVLGGRGMEVLHDLVDFENYINDAILASESNPILIDKFIENAIEIDVDALSDGEDVFVAGIMEHIEEAGIHSGDSACSLPPQSIPNSILNQIKEQTKALAHALKVIGLMNIQFAIKNGEVFLLEVNPRGSRTIPFVAKATGNSIAKLASLILSGKKLSELRLNKNIPQHVAVKEAVFPFSRFPGVDVFLGPEMKSTGEVMGIDMDFGRAFAKSQLAAGISLPKSGNVFISVKDTEKDAFIPICRELQNLGFNILATTGTQKLLYKNNIKARKINKVLEGRPHAVDAMLSNEIQLVFNTAHGISAIKDSFSLRQTALKNNIPYYTTVSGSRAAVEAIKSLQNEVLIPKAIQEYLPNDTEIA